jgi:uncharacterized protein
MKANIDTIIDTIILKVAAPCNLACTYCYEYATGDNTWRNKPKHLDPQIAKKLAERIDEHLCTNDIDSFNIVLHGGEPLLVGPEKLKEIFEALISQPSREKIRLHLQTNGLLIDEEFCSLFSKYNVQVGVSLDGDEEANRFRVDHAAKSTYKSAIKGIETLKQFAPKSFTGILSVINLDSNPVNAMRALFALNPPSMDLLHPFITHDMVSTEKEKEEIGHKLYAWTKAALDLWMSSTDYHATKIRFLEDAMKCAVNSPTKSDWFGTRQTSYLIVETDGSYDLQDHLKVAGNASTEIRALGKHVSEASIEDAGIIAEERIISLGADKTPAACHGCDWEQSCSGGFLPTRYSSEKLFDNPSVYCGGLMLLLANLRELLINANKVNV